MCFDAAKIDEIIDARYNESIMQCNSHQISYQLKYFYYFYAKNNAPAIV